MPQFTLTVLATVLGAVAIVAALIHAPLLAAACAVGGATLALEITR